MGWCPEGTEGRRRVGFGMGFHGDEEARENVEMPRVRLFHWKSKDAGPLIAKLHAAGYQVAHNAETQSPSVREIKESGAVAVVIDLSRLPSHGKYVGAWLRGSKSTRHIPLVFVGGEAEKVAAIKKQMPDAVYASVAGVGAALG